MTRRVIAMPVVALPLLVAVTASTAQQFDLNLPTPDQSRAGSSRQPGRPATPGAEIYPHRPPVPYEPGFVTPLSRETETGRMGAAGWTSPNTPAGSRVGTDPDNAGWFGSGLAIEWGGPRKSAIR